MRRSAGMARPLAATAAALGAVTALVVALSVPARNSEARAVTTTPDAPLQARIDAALPGTVVRVSGVERGPIVVRTPVHLAGEPGAVIDAGGRGTVVRIEAPGVVLTGLTLRASGSDLNTEDAGVYIGAPGAILDDLVLEDVLFGLNLKQANGATIRRLRMSGKDLPLSRRGDALRLWYSNEIVLSDVRVRRMRDVLVWFSRSSVLHALDVAGSRYGVHMMYADNVRLLDSTFRDNAVGAYIMYSTGVRVEGNRFLHHLDVTGVGLAFKESDDVLVRGNLFAGNRVGLYLDGTPHQANARSALLDNVVAGNATGILLLSSAAGNVIAGNRFDGNARQVRVEGGAQAGNTWTRGGRGNYWSDYAALDANRDGVGDVPYRAREWFEALADRLPAASFFWGSVAVEAVDFGARLLPFYEPRTLVEDPRPLMSAAVPVEHRGQSASTGFAAVSALLAVAGLASLVGTAKRGARAGRRWRDRRAT